MFTKSRIIDLIESLVGGIIFGAILIGAVALIVEIAIPYWVGGIVGGVLGLIYGFARDDDKPEETT